MQLPHAEHQTTVPIETLLQSLIEDAPQETELAASQSFYDDPEGKVFEIYDTYSQFFESKESDISKILGRPVFQGGLPGAMDWAEKLGIEPGFEKICVWKKDDKNVYLQIIWEDKDCPIVVSLGTAPN
jgi:hypothetical protein